MFNIASVQKRAFSTVQAHMSNLILDVLMNIHSLIPEGRPPSQRTRHTRSWLPFLGNVLKTVTGTATTEDVAKVARTVAQIRRNTIQAYDQWSHTEEELASAMHLANKRMTAIETLVETQRQSITAQYRTFATSLDELYTVTELIPVALNRTVDYSCALVHVSELRTALQDAINGRLSTFLDTLKWLKL